MRIIVIVAPLLLALYACVSAPPVPSAQQTFVTHCASCHGALGEGDGPMVTVMRVNVPNLRQLSARNGGTFPADAAASYIDGRNLPLSHGDRVMPVWGDVFDTTSAIMRDAESAQARIAGVVEYLEAIQYATP